MSAAPYASVKVYGRAAALCLCEASHRSSGAATVNVEGALAQGRAYDWQNKIIVQLSVAEMLQMLAVLEGRKAAAHFDGHGARRDKALHLQAQPRLTYIKLMQRGCPLVALPVTPADAMPLKLMLYARIRMNQPELTLADIRDLLG